MALPTVVATPLWPRCRSGGLPSRARLILVLVLAVAAGRFHLPSSPGFAAAPAGRARPAAVTLPSTTLAVTRGSRLPRASRGGEATDTIEVGDKVQAVSPDDEQRYPGTIDKINADGTYSVRWDDPDGGPEINDIAPDKVKKIIIFKDYSAGDDVQAVSPDDGQWYPGTVMKANTDGSFVVKWDDPEGGTETNDVKPQEMKKVTVFKDYKVDDAVLAIFPDDGEWYAGAVTKANDDGTFQVKWEDPDGGEPESTVRAKDLKYPPIPFDELEVGQKYKGVVRTITGFGAFVDIGAEGEGLVHISRITTERVDDPHDYLEEGQEVDVWVSGLKDDGKFGLTMVEGIVEGTRGARPRTDLTPFSELSPDEWQSGTVSGVRHFGAFVTVALPDGGPAADGLVHISQLKDDGFVENVEDEVEVGQEVQVRILSVDLERGKMSLSMRAGGSGGGMTRRGPADLSAFEGVSSDQWLKAKVAKVASFGAFVTVTSEDGAASADGLVHITQIRDGFVESVENELEIGQEVSVRVLSVDTVEGKMSLSMKTPDY
uniref:30S ribosomal protein S1 n=1 Tax=Pyrodinium bahamense TaxID=73915 RepID=A0A7S0AAQ5_9DINO